MINLDFKQLHAYLFNVGTGQSSPLHVAAGIRSGKPQYPQINLTNPKSGVHLVHRQFYNAGGLAFILYVKNTFDHDQLSGVKLCVKLLFTSKLKQGGFAKPKDPNNRIAFELSRDAEIGLFQCLQGKTSSFTYALPVSNAVPKDFVVSTLGDRLCVTATHGKISITTYLDTHIIFEASMVILATYKVLYPDLAMSLFVVCC